MCEEFLLYLLQWFECEFGHCIYMLYCQLIACRINWFDRSGTVVFVAKKKNVIRGKFSLRQHLITASAIEAVNSYKKWGKLVGNLQFLSSTTTVEVLLSKALCLIAHKRYITVFAASPRVHSTFSIIYICLNILKHTC